MNLGAIAQSNPQTAKNVLERSRIRVNDRTRPRMPLVSENPEIEIDLIYQLLRMAVSFTE